MLRQQSNVALDSVVLEGSATRRRLGLTVSVDGVENSALGVMSQGELNSLALCLFLPRATMPESPFRFVVIDDPVQSMDAAKVDGLAQVLAEVAGTRQVVVFTHDDRLPEAVERLRIAARIVEVSRRGHSQVELREASSIEATLFNDARALVLSDGVDPRLAAHVVPNLCRQALERVCTRVVQTRRLGRGEDHASVDTFLAGCTTLTLMVAGALFDDNERGGDVLRALNRRGAWAADTFQALNKGTHRPHLGDLKRLVKSAENLCDLLDPRPPR